MFGALPWATWDQAALAALLGGALVAALRGRRPTRLTTTVLPAAREFAFICAIYSVWRVARMLPLVHDQGALDRARALARFQDILHLPTEASVQQWVMGYDWLVRFSTLYYATVHVPALIVFMIWLWVRHRHHYKQWRTALALLTLFCLIIRFERVAPPRFLPELGFVDLSTRLGLSVYGPVGTGVSDQYAAMPSIHVAWAAVVSFGALAISTSPWRWLVFSHVFITIFVVAATGHHWWLDSIVAVALLGLGIVIDRYGRRWARRPGRAGTGLEPELVAA
ncbi:MAG: inositol phosphorylceramide synthase [Actinomycetia bacterium]|nr:inositol phosphorylceramide synthase [Actinomycetes bacterium]